MPTCWLCWGVSWYAVWPTWQFYEIISNPSPPPTLVSDLAGLHLALPRINTPCSLKTFPLTFWVFEENTLTRNTSNKTLCWCLASPFDNNIWLGMFNNFFLLPSLDINISHHLGQAYGDWHWYPIEGSWFQEHLTFLNASKLDIYLPPSSCLWMPSVITLIGA